MNLITTTQSTHINVAHNGEKDTLSELHEMVDGFFHDTGYCLNLYMVQNGTNIYITNMEVSQSGEADDSFQDAVQMFEESLEDAGFRIV